LLKRPAVSRRGLMTAMVLSIVFTIAVIIRAYSAKYGFYLNEFDPYFDYYAASHIVALAQQHGGIFGLYYALFNNNTATCAASVLAPACHAQTGYFYWHDVQTWFPYGRDVAATSQGGLQLAGAVLYLLINNVFGVQITLYDALVLLPVFFGAITSVMFYFLVRKIAGDAAGLFAALVFAVSPPLIERGNLGWFKSEPLAIMLFVGASYMMLSVFDKERSVRSRIIRATIGGVLAGYANTAWGGGDYFSASFGLMFVVIPFLGVDLASLSPAVISFTAATLFVSAIFPRPGVSIIGNPVGLALIGGTSFLLVAQWAKTWTKPAEYKTTLVKLIFAFVLAGLTLISFGLIGGLTLRYLTVVAPWLRGSAPPLLQSVAEHFVPTGADYFTSYALLLSLGMAGALIAFKRRSIPMIYALIFGLTGLYFSAAFSRLLVYSSIALGILGGIGFAELAFAIAKPSSTPLVKKKQAPTSRNEMKVVLTVAVIALVAIPAGTYWIPNPIACSSTVYIFCNQSPADSAVSLANGATTYQRASLSDWVQALQWVSHDTPSNSVVIAWWDYGYWFTVMGNRTSLVDNSTSNSTAIAQVGRLLMSNATQAATLAKHLAYDSSCQCTRPVYVAIFVTGSVVQLSSGNGGASQSYYTLQIPVGGWFGAGGGDESKKQWFIRIGGLNESQYLVCPKSSASCPNVDDFNLTPYALSNSLFAQLLPFKFSGNFLVLTQSGTSLSVQVSPTYQFGYQGLPPVEAFNLGYTFPANSTGPFRLAFASSSISSPFTCATNFGCFTSVLIYQVV
jgi:dolichyl-diphosphooligosaccharide--protein glycosyltransferase